MIYDVDPEDIVFIMERIEEFDRLSSTMTIRGGVVIR